jgi:hypothetical protein
VVRRYEYVAYLVFAEEGEMEDDLEGLSIGGEEDEVGNTSVEGLGCLVGTLLQL